MKDIRSFYRWLVYRCEEDGTHRVERAKIAALVQFLISREGGYVATGLYASEWSELCDWASWHRNLREGEER